MLTEHDRDALCTWARDVIRAELDSRSLRAPQLDVGDPMSATFVTLRWPEGELQGCIGNLTPSRALRDAIAVNARAAAFEDPRNRRLTLDDVDRLDVEISLLSELTPIDFDSEDGAIAALRPHVDGVVLEWREHRGTFLPQVWDELPTPRQFLGQLKRKAGLSPGFWHPQLRLSRYSVEKWTEPGVGA